MSDLSAIEALHRSLFQRLDERAAQVATREAELRQGLEKCAAERREIERERQIILEAAQIYGRELDAGVQTGRLFEETAPAAPPLAPPRIHAHPKAPRARIGPQRYRMLYLLAAAMIAMSPDDLAAETGLPARRVKDQMAADCAIGVVVAEPGTPENTYRITPVGLDLLSRFEAYKKAHGQSLPSLSGPLDDDRDEVARSDGECEGAQE